MPSRSSPASDDNIKLTYPEDLARLERIMAALPPALIPRVGTGFDVHVLEAGRPLVLCGVAVPHDKGLAGHSDADVGIHALCDAIYGALAEGDIGRHFPPSEADLEGRRQRPLPGPCRRPDRRARRAAGQRRRHADLRAAEDRPARRRRCARGWRRCWGSIRAASRSRPQRRRGSASPAAARASPRRRLSCVLLPG